MVKETEKRTVITIDGLAGSGKTSLAAQLALRLRFVHMSSGMLYRALGWLALQLQLDLDDSERLARLVAEHRLELSADCERSSRIIVDGRDISAHVSAPMISEATSRISRHARVRSALLPLQREAFPGHDLVAEGRDMGTVVFPDADLKFFIEAGSEVRVARRMQQLFGNGDLPVEERERVKKDLEIEVLQRDKRDSEREASPTIPACDAILIDNSIETLTNVVQYMYDRVSQRGLVKSA